MQPSAPSRVRGFRVSPPAAVGIGAGLLFLLFAAGTAWQITVQPAFDEGVYKIAAADYANRGVTAIFDGQVSRGTARLFSTLLAPIFAVFPGDEAVRWGRVFTTAIWFLTALPLYLLGRRLMTSRWHAVAAALLAVAGPWAAISTVMFSEALSYLLFATMLLVGLRTLAAPTWRRELLVLVLIGALIGTRVQFGVLPAAWIAAVLVLELPGARAVAGSWRDALVALWRRFPVTMTMAGLGVVGVVLLLLGGAAGGPFDKLTGPYREIQGRDTLPTDIGTALLFETAMLALGTGLIPAILAASWLRGAFRPAADPEARRFAVLAVAALIGMAAVTVAATGGWQGPDVTEERYYVYGVPVIVLGALAALERTVLRASTLAWGGAAMAALLALAPTTAGLSGERAFLVPVAASTTNIGARMNGWIADQLGLQAAFGQRDLLVVLVVLVTVLSIVALRRARWAVLIPAVVLQLGFTGYALATMHGKVPGVPGLTNEYDLKLRAWVDHSPLAEGGVALVSDRIAAGALAENDVTFWNDRVEATISAPETGRGAAPYPTSGLPALAVTVGPDRALQPPPSNAKAVTTVDSPVLQLAGRRLAAGEPSSQLIELAQPPRATWVTRALGPEGGFPQPVTVSHAPARLVLRLVAPPEGPGGTLDVDLGARARTVTLKPGQTRELTIDACRRDEGTITPQGAVGGSVRLEAVRLEACGG